MIIICMSYSIIDLVTDHRSNERISIFKEFIKNTGTSDPLYKNYELLDINDFICLTAVLENDEIVALSGIQYFPERWGNNIVRMSTRFWMHPKYRITSLSKFKHDSRFYFNSQLMIPYQLTFIKQKKIPFAIITREGNYKRSFTKFIELVNHYNSTNFLLLDGIYNVCQPMNNVPDSCKQMIAFCSFDNFCFQEELQLLHIENKLKFI